jgi:hypothetical protein
VACEAHLGFRRDSRRRGGGPLAATGSHAPMSSPLPDSRSASLSHSHLCSIDSLPSSSSSTFYIRYASIPHPQVQIECRWASIYLHQAQIERWHRFLLPGHRSRTIKLWSSIPSCRSSSASVEDLEACHWMIYHVPVHMFCWMWLSQLI